MDFNVVTLEIFDHLFHFHYFDNLVNQMQGKEDDAVEEQEKINNKSKEHLTKFFAGTTFCDEHNQLRPLAEIKGTIIAKLEGTKSKDIHDMVEKLEKDAKKMKKLYVSLTKK